MRTLLKEMKALRKTPPDGINLVLSDDVSAIVADITGPDATPFQGGLFRVKLTLGGDFPQTPPQGFFLTRIFHPNVRPETGEICVSILKKDWKPELGIREVLLTIKSLMISPNPESALNELAGKLMLEAFDEYARRAALMTSIHSLPSSAGNPAAVGAEPVAVGALASAGAEPAAAAAPADEDANETPGGEEDASLTDATNTGDAAVQSTASPRKADGAAAARKDKATKDKKKVGLKRL